MVRQFSAGGIVYKKEGEETFWLIIRPNIEGKERWQLPKGWINDGEKTEEAAVREAREEGGVEVRPIAKVDSFKVIFSNTFEGKPEEKILKTITFYLMEYQGDLPQGHDEEVAETVWLPLKEAQEKLTFKNEKAILLKAKEILDHQELQSSLFEAK